MFGAANAVPCGVGSPTSGYQSGRYRPFHPTTGIGVVAAKARIVRTASVGARHGGRRARFTACCEANEWRLQQTLCSSRGCLRGSGPAFRRALENWIEPSATTEPLYALGPLGRKRIKGSAQPNRSTVVVVTFAAYI